MGSSSIVLLLLSCAVPAALALAGHRSDASDANDECVFSPDYAAVHRCMGINRTDLFKPWEIACRKLQCMSCVAVEETTQACRADWQESCEWGRDAVNRPMCEKQCTRELCEKHCQDTYGNDFESFSCAPQLNEFGGACEIQCRKKCDAEIKQLPSGEWYCCEAGSFVERIANKRRFATCEGSPMPVHSHLETCATCAVNCHGRRYGVCSWKSWVIEEPAKSASLRMSPVFFSLLITLVGTLAHGMPVRCLAFACLLVVGCASFELELTHTIPRTSMDVTKDKFSKQCTAHGVESAASRSLHPFAQSVLHSEPLGNIVANVSTWAQLTVDSHQILATTHVSGGINFWQIGSFDLISPARGTKSLGHTSPEVLTNFYVPGETRSAYLAAGWADGSLRAWRLNAADSNGPLHVSVQEEFLDAWSHGGHKVLSLLMVPHAGGLLTSGGMDRRLVFRSVHNLSIVAGELDGFDWPPIALAWAGEADGVLAVAGDYDMISFWRPSNHKGNCLGWTRVGRSKPTMLQTHSVMSPLVPQASARILSLSSIPGGAVAASTQGGFRILHQNTTELASWQGQVLGGPVWIHGADVLAVLAEPSNGDGTSLELLLFGWPKLAHLFTIQLTSRRRIQQMQIPIMFVDFPSELFLLGGEQIELVKLISRLCESGSFPHDSHRLCTPCLAGTAGYLEPGLCSTCTQGKHQSETGMASCKDCEPGRFSDTEGATTCPWCPAGRFSDVPGSTRCDGICPPGQQSAGAHCEPCPKGRAGQGGTCQPCPRWQLATKYGLPSCSEFCPPGDFPTPNRTACLSFTPGNMSKEPKEPMDLAYIYKILIAVLAAACVSHSLWCRYKLRQDKRQQHE